MTSSLTEWLMTHYGREEVKKETGLTRIRAALHDLLPSLNQKKIITIAGTNGKGETTLWLSRELGNTSHCTWISPHVERITERFRNENGEIEEDLLQELVESCHELVRKNGYQLSYYEFLFFVFCHWAHRKNADVLLLEVGLGGRLDAVNIFDAKIVLLPSISRDHQEFLGNRYDLILKEKLGLLRRGTKLISFLHLQYLKERAREISLAIGAEFIDLEEHSGALPYEFSRRNQTLAHAASLVLEGKSLSELKNFVSREENLEHRGEHWKHQGDWIFYGSHNVDGVRNLIQFLGSAHYNFPRPPYDAVLVSFSRRDVRDIRVMLSMLKRSGLGNILVTTFPHPKAATQETLESLAAHEGISFVQDLEEYIQHSAGTKVLVAGSYYFLGHIKSLVRRR